MNVALTIAGSDSGGGAGIQADLATFTALGLHGTCAITAITAQNSVVVARIAPLDADLVTAQIEAIAADMRVSTVKTGMLATGAIVSAVAATIRRLSLPAPVVDPVMRASAGGALLDPAALEVLRTQLVPLASVFTPNLAEAETLLGRTVRDVTAMREAARTFLAWGARAIVVKGGHLEGAAVDVFADGSRVEALDGPRLSTPHVHGTGCVFSAAIAARLAYGDEPLAAVRAAKAFTADAIRRGAPLGRGPGAVRPIAPKAG